MIRKGEVERVGSVLGEERRGGIERNRSGKRRERGRSYLIVGEELRPKDKIIRIMRFIICKCMKCQSRYILSAHERNAAIAGTGVDFGFIAD
jgi:hypothetical protein